MDKEILYDWFDDYKSYIYAFVFLIFAVILYVVIMFSMQDREVTELPPVRSVLNIFYQGSQHSLVTILSNIDLLEGRVLRIQLGRLDEAKLLTIVDYGIVTPIEGIVFEDNRYILDATLSTSIFWSTPVFNSIGGIIGVYLEEVSYGRFLEVWLLTGEYTESEAIEIPCGYEDDCL